MFLHFPGVPRNIHYKTQTFIQLTCTTRKSGYVEQNAPDFLVVVVNAFHSSHLLPLKTL